MIAFFRLFVLSMGKNCSLKDPIKKKKERRNKNVLKCEDVNVERKTLLCPSQPHSRKSIRNPNQRMGFYYKEKDVFLPKADWARVRFLTGKESFLGNFHKPNRGRSFNFFFHSSFDCSFVCKFQ